MKRSDSKKEMFSVMTNICARVVTLIFVFITLFRKFFNPSGNLMMGIDDILGVIFIGAVSSLAFGIFYVKNNLSARGTALLQLLYFAIINVTVCATGFCLNWFKIELKPILVVEAMFVLIYFLVTFCVYMFDFNEAKKINEKLKARKNK
ncbi:MAG: DUF3021 domain-containing protein [Treponema sp.]|nr:DUF3021 domain-containing protein [Treponema sp.]